MNTPLIIYDGACDKFTVETQNWQCNQVGNTKKKEKHTGKRERGVCYWKVLEETIRDVQIKHNHVRSQLTFQKIVIWYPY